jgi:hypothetical protein
MGTAALVGFKLPPTADGRSGPAVRAAYIHLDGGTDQVGERLKKEYNSEHGAMAIVAAGYISSLEKGKTLSECLEGSYNHLPPTDYNRVGEFFDDGAPFHYLWQDGQWFCLGYNHPLGPL